MKCKECGDNHSHIGEYLTLYIQRPAGFHVGFRLCVESRWMIELSLFLGFLRLTLDFNWGYWHKQHGRRKGTQA